MANPSLFLACLLLALANPAAAGPLPEDDAGSGADAPAEPGPDAPAVPRGAWREGTLGPLDQADVYAFDADAGDALLVKVRSWSGDVCLRVWGPDGVEPATYFCAVPPGADFPFAAAQGGTHHLEVTKGLDHLLYDEPEVGGVPVTPGAATSLRYAFAVEP